jgi:hypothetical protein
MSVSRTSETFVRVGFGVDWAVPPVGRPQTIEYDEGGGTLEFRWTANSNASIQASNLWTILPHSAGAGTLSLPATARRVAVQAVTLGTPAPVATLVSQGVSGAENARHYSTGQPALVTDSVKIAPPGAPIVWYDFTDPATVFSDVAGNSLATIGGRINRVRDKGSAGIDAATGFGTTSLAPLYVANAINAFNGVLFTASGTEGLQSVSNFDATQIIHGLVIARSEIVTGAGTDIVLGPDTGDDTFLVAGATASHKVEGPLGKASQLLSTTKMGVFAAWAIQTATTSEVSLSNVAGTEPKVYGTSNTPAAPPITMGCNAVATTRYHDGWITEVLYWDTVVPTPAEMEAYATARYGIVWL